MQKFQMIKTLCLIGVCIFYLNTTLAAEPNAAGENDKQTKVAVVNGSVISKHDFDVSFNTFSRETSMNIGRPLTESELSKIKGDVLEELINQKILLQASMTQNTQIDEQAYQKKLTELDEQIKNDPTLKAEIEKTQYSMDDIHSQIRENMIINKYLEESFLKPAVATEEEAREYYDKNKEQFIYPEKIRAQHILIKPTPPDSPSTRAEALKKITEIQEKLKTNKDFEGLARTYSQCPSKEQGGDLGFFSHGQMVPPFEEAAFALNINEISDIVETQFGYHLIKLTGKVAETTIPFEQVKSELQTALKKEKASKNVEAFLDEAKRSGSIELFLN